MSLYKRVIFRTDNVEEDFVNDLLPTLLGEVGFDCFEETPRGIIGYCPAQLFDLQKIVDAVSTLPINDSSRITYSILDVEESNWNALWEQNGFKPIKIDTECIVHSSNHTIDKSYKYNIQINPEMAFGSGSHATTRIMLRFLLQHYLRNKSVIDIGCGTGILSIMASKRGAKSVFAIDIDERSVRNAMHNLQINQCENIRVYHGDASLLDKMPKSDLLLANINRNILLADMSAYHNVLTDGGKMVLSGFYESDVPLLVDKALQLGFLFVEKMTEDEWRALIFEKI